MTKFFDFSSEEEKARSVLRVVALTSFLVMLGVLVYGAVSALEGSAQVGLNLVDAEFPPANAFPIYFKPITYLYVSSLLFLYSFLELNRSRIAGYPPAVRTVAKLFSFFVAVTFAYEVFYNFTLWGGQMAAESVQGRLNPDLIANPFPSLAVPWNLVFATKLWTMFTIMGVYAFYFFSKLDK